MDDEKIPSIGISYQVQTRPTRTLVLQAFIDRDCEPVVLNALLDKLRSASERQQAWEVLDDLKKEIKRHRSLAEKQAIAIQKADEEIKRQWDRSNKRGDIQLSDIEIKRQREAYEHAENLKHQLEVMMDDLAKYEAIIANGGMGGVPVGAG